jgi:hypothetical protein
MIDRNHRLLGVESQRDGYLFHRINRSSVNVRLTRFAQSPVARSNAETFEQAFERGRPAIHSRSLHDFGSEYPTIRVTGGHREASRRKPEM